ncbi:MAG: Grx4 family monothiol glutaredoxin [Pseudomonadota bacterium]|jgi:monothiol glutaredoxin
MSAQDALQQIKTDVESNPICLFMKGTPEAPQCGFSAQVVHILNSYGVKYHAVNVLASWDIREGIKQYTNWPTIPQLYVNGKFVGGCDITAELHRKGQLADVLSAVQK